jgi:hypothetical protein
MSWVAALLVPAVLLVGSLGADDKKPNPDKDADKPTEKWVKVGVVAGRLITVYEDKRKFRLQITIPVTKLNQGALAGLQQAQVQMAQARAQGNLQGILQAQVAMQQHQRNLYTIEKHTKELEFQAIDDVLVRTAKPREMFDEKGRIKKLTKAERKELKGPNPKTPGYKAEFGDLTAEQVLQVTVVRKKGAAKVVRPKGKKGKDADVLDADLGDDTLHVSMIMILADPPPAK